MTSRLPGREGDVLADRECGQRRKPARVGAADVQPAELDALNEGVLSRWPKRQYSEAVLHGEVAALVIPGGLRVATMTSCPSGAISALLIEPAAATPLGTISFASARLLPGAAVSSSRTPSVTRTSWSTVRCQVKAIIRLPSAQEGGPGTYWGPCAGAVQVRVVPVARLMTWSRAERLDELGALLEQDGGVCVLTLGRDDPGLVPAGDRAAAERGPAAVQHGGPRVVQGARLLAQGPPPAVQLLEGVLHDVFGGGQITYDQHGQPDQFQVMAPG